MLPECSFEDRTASKPDVFIRRRPLNASRQSSEQALSPPISSAHGQAPGSAIILACFDYCVAVCVTLIFDRRGGPGLCHPVRSPECDQTGNGLVV